MDADAAWFGPDKSQCNPAQEQFPALGVYICGPIKPSAKSEMPQNTEYSCDVCQHAFPCDRQGARERARLLPEASQERQLRLLCKDCYLKITNTEHLYRRPRPRRRVPPQHGVQ
jgi:hypothetical protein